MIKIVSLDSKTIVEISFATNEPFFLFGASQMRATCCLTQGGRKLSVEADYDRKNLFDFGLELLTMHRNLTPGASTSIWSSQGNVAISVLLGERGSVLFKCILVEHGSSNERGLCAKVVVDQTYLPEIANQAQELSKETTPWSN